MLLQYSPPHPGKFIKRVFIEGQHLDPNEIARRLYIDTAELWDLLNGVSSVSTVLASRLSDVFGRSYESWLAMQRNYDLWISKNGLHGAG
jgi:antitoxin HigA-1